MAIEFDPRPWNLATGLAGLALLSVGCGGRTISGDSNTSGDATTTDTNTDDASTTDTNTTSTETGGECVTDADCPPGVYYCQGGYCYYANFPDGSLWYECYNHNECDPLEQCMGGYCEPVEVPAACGASMGDVSIPLSFDGAALALVFADVDSDGAAELVVATQDQLHVFEAGVDTPTATSPRTVISPTIKAAASGQLNANPGEDIVLMVGEELLIHSSDGVSGFAGPSVNPSMVGVGFGLRAGDLDGQAPADLLVFGELGAHIDRGGGDVTSLSMEEIRSGVIRDQGLAGAGVMLGHLSVLEFFDLAGISQTLEQPTATNLNLPPTPLAAFMTGGVPHNLSCGQVSGWMLMEQWGPAGGKLGEWGVEFYVVDIAVGDVDGDGDDELILLDDAGGLWLHRPGLGAGCIRSIDVGPLVSGIAVGDQDGDGDDELAVSFGTGEVAIVTVG